MKRADMRAAVLAAPPRCRPTLLALVTYADETGLASPSVASLAHLAGEHPGTTRRHLGELATAGAILALGGRSGGRKPTAWRVFVPLTEPVENLGQPAQDTRPPRAEHAGYPAHETREGAHSPPFNPRTVRAEEMKRIEEAFRARDGDDLAPGELPPPMTPDEARQRVDALRAALEAEPPPREPYEPEPAPHLADPAITAPDEIAARVAALRDARRGHRGGQPLLHTTGRGPRCPMTTTAGCREWQRRPVACRWAGLSGP